MERLAQAGLIKGKTIGVDSTTLEANAAMKSRSRTGLAYKAENGVDMDSGAIVAVTTHGGAEADTATIQQTVAEAGIAVAELIAVQSEEGSYPVAEGGVQEVVADKGYHSKAS